MNSRFLLTFLSRRAKEENFHRSIASPAYRTNPLRTVVRRLANITRRPLIPSDTRFFETRESAGDREQIRNRDGSGKVWSFLYTGKIEEKFCPTTTKNSGRSLIMRTPIETLSEDEFLRDLVRFHSPLGIALFGFPIARWRLDGDFTARLLTC